MADTAAVVQAALDLPGLTVSVLVPNLKGAQAAMASGAHALLVPLSASQAHSLANLRKTPEAVVEVIARIRDLRDAMGARCQIEVGVSTAFGCTLQGAVPEEDVLRLLEAAVHAGAEQVGLADTVGYADPGQVTRLFAAGRRLVGDRLSCAHFHDTRGLGLANAFAAWQVGIRKFDACLGGIGGCPHAPGASGNVATEDLAYLFQSMQVPTGLEVRSLLALRQRLAQEWLPGEALHGHIWRAGPPKTLLETV